jgi:hypothetical protein
LALSGIRWRGEAKTIVHIADAPAHGARFCGCENHEDESSKPEPLIKAVAQQGILVMGLSLNGGATLSFNVCKAIYDAAGGRKYTIESFVVDGRWGEGAVRRHGCCRSIKSWSLGKKKKYEMRRSRDADDLCEEEEPPTSGGIGAKLATATASVCEDALAMEYA